MATHEGEGRRRAALDGDGTDGGSLAFEPMPPALLDEPLDYIFADHFRQRCLCLALRRFAERRLAPRAEADLAAAYMRHDLPLHHLDEDETLFPLLRRRALPQDALDRTLDRLSDDHERAEPLEQAIIAALTARPRDGDAPIDAAAASAMLRYAAQEQQHLAMENAIVLAIARIRLKRCDLAALSLAMKSRRGL